jgi:hypothetical protein
MQNRVIMMKGRQVVAEANNLNHIPRIGEKVSIMDSARHKHIFKVIDVEYGIPLGTANSIDILVSLEGNYV